ncbi:MAG: heavy metal-responsive transcriptional regulator [Gammaproteobacteria bacterium]
MGKQAMRQMTIGRLARNAGVGAETLRYYEHLGLIRPDRRTESNYRLYGPEAERRLVFIRRAQVLGFSLEEIRELLSLHHRADAGADEVKSIAEKRIREVETRIHDLECMRDGLEALSAQCDGKGSADNCPILAALLNAEPA